jgi:hypothetical protein
MSLIFTSNTQDDYKDFDTEGRSLRAPIGIERPSDYHNHLTSPLEVKPNSQIAVQSVKLQRQQTYEVTDSLNMLYYFGEPLGTTNSLNDVTKRPNLISIPRGVYDRTEFASQLQTEMNNMNTVPAVHNNFRVSASLANGEFLGYKISASQNGTTYSDRSSTLNTSLADVYVAIGSTPTSDNFTLAGGVFTRTGASGTIKDELCCGIATDFPLAMGQNACMTVDLLGASYSDGEGGFLNSSWAIGLTRPTIQLNNDNTTGKSHGNAPIDFNRQKSAVNPHFWDYVAIFDAEDGSSASGALTLYQANYLKDADGNAIAESYKMREISYYGGAGQIASQITNASINASGEYHFLEWSFEGEEVRLALKKGGGQHTFLIDSGNNQNASRVFKPTTDFTGTLYPKICLSQGSVTITNYDTYSATNETYKYPTYTGYDPTDMSGGTYTVGDSPYANFIGRSKLMRSDGIRGDTDVVGLKPSWGERTAGRVTNFIFKPDYAYGQMLPEDFETSTETINFQGNNANGGIDYEHLLVIADTTPPDSQDQSIGNYYSSMCNMGRYIGWNDLSIITQAEGTVTASNLVTWTSPNVPEFKVNSAFVRISNLNHRTYNSCKNSISKILYHVPRFTNDGRQFGDLFWEVGEKTYVDLNNTETFTLNQLQVQIVDKNERIVDDLVGDTIIVFHIKQK